MIAVEGGVAGVAEGFVEALRGGVVHGCLERDAHRPLAAREGVRGLEQRAPDAAPARRGSTNRSFSTKIRAIATEESEGRAV